MRRHLVTIQRRPSAGTVDSSFAPVDGEWTKLGDDYAQKIELGGEERFHASQLSAKYDTRWRLRYRADMDPDLIDVSYTRRLVYRTRVHDIVSAITTDRGGDIELETISTSVVVEGC